MRLWPELFADAPVAATVQALAELWGAVVALEVGVSTGRVGQRLSRAGVLMHGIDVSPAMVARVNAQPRSSPGDVTIGIEHDG